MSYHPFKLSKVILIPLLAAVIMIPLATTALPASGASKSSKISTSKTKKTSKKTAKKTSKKIAKCDSNYSSCVPVASDVDCQPGSGDGPAYISAPVKILRNDPYRLDFDKDGIGCERD